MNHDSFACIRSLFFGIIFYNSDLFSVNICICKYRPLYNFCQYFCYLTVSNICITENDVFKIVLRVFLPDSAFPPVFSMRNSQCAIRNYYSLSNYALRITHCKLVMSLSPNKNQKAAQNANFFYFFLEFV